MRKIKFRAWDNIDSEMRDVIAADFRNEEWIGAPVFDGDGFNLERRKFSDVVLMQFTGLKEKNGKEIYEGDVVRVNVPTPASTYPADHERVTGFVEWDNEGADYDIVRNGKCLRRLGFAGAIYEILDNLYENPEPLSAT